MLTPACAVVRLITVFAIASIIVIFFMILFEDRRKAEKLDFSDSDVWETKTVTSALKNYFRSVESMVSCQCDQP